MNNQNQNNEMNVTHNGNIISDRDKLRLGIRIDVMGNGIMKGKMNLKKESFKDGLKGKFNKVNTFYDRGGVTATALTCLQPTPTKSSSGISHSKMQLQTLRSFTFCFNNSFLTKEVIPLLKIKTSYTNDYAGVTGML